MLLFDDDDENVMDGVVWCGVQIKEQPESSGDSCSGERSS
jgi:hypothetical protein